LGLVLGLGCFEVGFGGGFGVSIDVRKCLGGVKVVWMGFWVSRMCFGGVEGWEWVLEGVECGLRVVY
jgi:hypothetical protein